MDIEMSKKKTAVVVNDVETWFCPGCGQHKLAKDFYRSAYSPNGLSSYCRPCQNGLSRDYQQRQVKVRREERAELARLRKLVEKAA
jgi:hypothetical protein